MQPRMCSQFLVSRPCKTSSPLPCFIGDAFSYRSDHNKWKNQRLPKMRHPTIIQRRPFLREKTDDLGYFEVAKTPKWGLNFNQVLIYGATMSGTCHVTVTWIRRAFPAAQLLFWKSPRHCLRLGDFKLLIEGMTLWSCHPGSTPTNPARRSLNSSTCGCWAGFQWYFGQLTMGAPPAAKGTIGHPKVSCRLSTCRVLVVDVSWTEQHEQSTFLVGGFNMF